jgi:hypothetical protein
MNAIQTQKLLEESLLAAYMGFIPEADVPLDRFIEHGGWLLGQARCTDWEAFLRELDAEASRILVQQPRLSAQLVLLATFLRHPPAALPDAVYREVKFGAFFAAKAPGALLADKTAVVEKVLERHGNPFRRYCGSKQLAWDALAPASLADLEGGGRGVRGTGRVWQKEGRPRGADRRARNRVCPPALAAQ